MRDLLKEFDNNIKVIREWYSDDSGKPNEQFIITHHEKDYKAYRSMQKAMERAIALAARGSRRSTQSK